MSQRPGGTTRRAGAGGSRRKEAVRGHSPARRAACTTPQMPRPRGLGRLVRTHARTHSSGRVPAHVLDCPLTPSHALARPRTAQPARNRDPGKPCRRGKGDRGVWAQVSDEFECRRLLSCCMHFAAGHIGPVNEMKCPDHKEISILFICLFCSSRDGTQGLFPLYH
jgi:hypothetical protein